ncbi:MAG: hypothetical protein WKF60_06345 [Ilumatobacter sp.]
MDGRDTEPGTVHHWIGRRLWPEFVEDGIPHVPLRRVQPTLTPGT